MIKQPKPCLQSCKENKFVWLRYNLDPDYKQIWHCQTRKQFLGRFTLPDLSFLRWRLKISRSSGQQRAVYRGPLSEGSVFCFTQQGWGRSRPIWARDTHWAIWGLTFAVEIYFGGYFWKHSKRFKTYFKFDELFISNDEKVSNDWIGFEAITKANWIESNLRETRISI